MPVGDRGVYNIWDLRDQARRRLPRAFFEFVDRGSEDEVALANNRAALERIKLRPRVLVDVSERSQEITLFGRRQSSPLVIGPTGIADLLWYRGEVALAGAAAGVGIPFTQVTSSTTPVERVAAAATAGFWYQMYMWDDRAMSHAVADRAHAAGAEALVLTVDTVVSPNREFNQRNGFTFPFRFGPRVMADLLSHPRWLTGVMLRYLAGEGMPRFVNYPKEMQTSVTGKPYRQTNSASITWDDVDQLKARWPGKLILKGILTPEDAELAVAHGADAVVVSNHGGPNLDSTMAPIDVLPGIAAAVDGRIAVLFDGGVRRGSDVVKAVALGADAVLIGRATLYGLGAPGETGVRLALDVLMQEIDRTLAYIGVRDIREVGPACIHRQG